MKTIITEEMRVRQRAVEYAIKYENNSKSARKYHTSRQQIKRWRDKYDGTVGSLANKSRRPKSHPNQHTNEELDLLKTKYKKFKIYGLAQEYVEDKKNNIIINNSNYYGDISIVLKRKKSNSSGFCNAAFGSIRVY